MAGLLDAAGVSDLFNLHEAEDSPGRPPGWRESSQTQLDAVINHLIGVQALHRHFIAQDIPARARRMAAELGWRAAGAVSQRTERGAAR